MNRILSIIAFACIACTARAADHAVILQYHHVAANTPRATSIDPALFAQHLEYLADHGYRVMPLPELLDKLHAGQAVPDKSVALSFDDAYRNVYEQAFPLLKQRRWPFTIFVNSEPVDRGFASHASWQQLREMAAAGAAIANHSASHAHLGARHAGEDQAGWRDRVTADIEAAQQRIEAETGQRHRLFAYHYGEFTPELRQLITGLGYFGIGQQSGPVGRHSDFSALPRFPMAADYAVISALKEKLATRPLPIAAVKRPGNPLSAGERPLLEITLEAPLDDPGRLQCYASGQGSIPVSWQGRLKFSARSDQSVPAGRSRYNCTAPAPGGGFFWYSAAWISLDSKNRWPSD